MPSGSSSSLTCHSVSNMNTNVRQTSKHKHVSNMLIDSSGHSGVLNAWPRLIRSTLLGVCQLHWLRGFLECLLKPIYPWASLQALYLKLNNISPGASWQIALAKVCCGISVGRFSSNEEHETALFVHMCALSHQHLAAGRATHFGSMVTWFVQWTV